MLGFISRFLKLWHQRRNPREITSDFKLFAHENATRVHLAIDSGSLPKNHQESYEKLLVRFIRTTGKSPFVGDENFKEANKLLFQYGIF